MPSIAASIVIHVSRAVRLIPKGKFNSIPEPKFVIDGAKIVLYSMLGRADGLRNFSVLEPLGDKLDNSPFPFGGNTFSVALSSEHNCPLVETAQGLRCGNRGRKAK